MVLWSGCASLAPETRVTVVESQRVLLVTSPMGPQALAGSSGIGLTGQVMAGDAVTTSPGSGVAFARLQPNLGTVFQVDDWYFGGHVSLVSGTFDALRATRGGLGVTENQFAWEAIGLLGRDVKLTSRFGLNISGEVGVASAALHTRSELGSSDSTLLYPALRGSVGAFATPLDALRVFAGVTVTTTGWNTPTSVITQTCEVTCIETDNGVAAFTGLGMAGGGVRWQAARAVSLGAELWVPFTTNSAGIPPQLAVTVRFGDFAFTPSVRPMPPPPPPPQVEPLPSPAPLGV